MPTITPARRRHMHMRRPAGVCAWAALCAMGACASPLDYLPGAGAGEIAPERTRRLDPISLRELSETEPIPVEQAAEHAVREIVEMAPTPATMALSLEEVRAAALANNLDLTVELFEPAIAQTFVNEEEAKFEAAFFGSARRTRTDSPTALGTEGSRITADIFELGVDVPLITGGSAQVSVPFSSVDTNNPFSLLNPAHEAATRFSISQPLLRGAWPAANTHSIRVSRYQRVLVDALTKLEAIRVLANADRAYWLLYAARRELEVRQQQYRLAVALLERARRLVAAGDTAEIEIIRAESGVAQSLEAIIIAQTNLRRAQRDLKRLINRDDLPMSGPTAIIPTTEAAPAGLDLDAEALAAFAVANRMDMLELELQLAIDSSAIDFERNAALPLVVLDYSYTINGLGRTYNRAFDQLPDRSFEDWSLGLNFEIPIGNEAAESRVNRAILQRLQRMATVEQRRAAIEQEVFDSLDALEQNWQRILAASLEAVAAGRTFEAEQRQFEVGLRTSTDVLDAAAALADAQSREVAALADYEIAQVDIAFATGTLLGRDRIHWEPLGLDESQADSVFRDFTRRPRPRLRR